MFTGIVEETGLVLDARETQNGIRLRVETGLVGGDARIGDSLAVNGCCLTVVEIAEKGRILGFDLLRETWQRTNLGSAGPGALVNLERSLRADGRIHGHFVTGHIDGTARIKE